MAEARAAGDASVANSLRRSRGAMTEHELTSLVFELFRDMDSMIEFWIQATFAVVVAVFVAGNRLSQWMRRVIATLYLLASVIAALRWNVLGYRASQYRERLLEGGYRDIATIPVVINVVSVLIALMFLVAVISTIRLLLQPGVGRAAAAVAVSPQPEPPQ